MKTKTSLNPCSNGIRKYNNKTFMSNLMNRLNPCSNGIRKYRTYKF